MNARWIKRLISTIAIVSLTSSCEMYRLEELRNTTPQGTQFQNELSQMYRDFATDLEKEYDWENSWHFADKGLMLAYGKDMPPEDPNNWNIPEDVLPEMEKARAMLLTVLTPDIMHDSPTRAAEAQFYFDCWVDKQGGWQQDRIDFCRDNLMQTLEGLLIQMQGDEEVAAEPPPVAPKPVHKKSKAAPLPKVAKEPEAAIKPAEVKKPAPVMKEAHMDTISYVVFFESANAQIAESGNNVIGEVIASLKNVSNYEIVLHAGPIDGAAADLPEQRVTAVKKRLTESGVPERVIKTEPTPGIALNRRIDIFLNE